MNTQIADPQAPVIAATHPEPGKLQRLCFFIFFALPGAWLVGTCAPLIVTITANQPDVAFCCLLGSLLILGAALLLYGTRTGNEPLFLIVFIPMPVLISFGYHLGYLGNDTGFFVAVLGMIWPVIVYRPVSRFYKRRELRWAMAQSNTVEQLLQVTGYKLPVEKLATNDTAAFTSQPSIFDHPLND